MTISGERTEQLDIFCRVTDFTSDFLSFIDMELIRFFHVALQLYITVAKTSSFQDQVSLCVSGSPFVLQIPVLQY